MHWKNDSAEGEREFLVFILSGMTKIENYLVITSDAVQN
jgi:hypothetical protein